MFIRTAGTSARTAYRALKDAQRDSQATPAATHVPDDLRIGDLVFIRVRARPFLEVAAATNSWTNHVGVVVGNDANGPSIAESTFPFARATPIADFLGRSEHGRCAVARMTTPLDDAQCAALVAAARRRMGTLYDTGFNLHSRRQFCSRFVREVIHDATGIQIGETETFAALLRRHPGARLGFWRLWYLGSIPWQRVTVTPASVLRSPCLQVVFDGAFPHAGKRITPPRAWHTRVRRLRPGRASEWISPPECRAQTTS